MGVIPFYGAVDRAMFEIERRAMDRPGCVLAALDRRLPTAGLVLDIGAGDGFTADRLSTDRRTILPLEPARGMIRPERSPRWVQGEAERLPFAQLHSTPPMRPGPTSSPPKDGTRRAGLPNCIGSCVPAVRC